MDGLTIAINNINNESLTLISEILDSKIIYSLILLGFILWFERNNEKRGKLFVVLILAFLIGTTIKEITQIPRPCAELILKTDCGSGYSFPSIHTLTAFTLALGFLDRKKYGIMLFFALFVAFSRIYLGVHTFIDIAGAVVLSPIIYGIVDYYWKRRK